MLLMELRRRFRVKAFLALTTAVQVVAIVFGLSVLLQGSPASAVASVPYLINFQGRLTDNSGNVLSDGSYNVKFRLFDALTAGTNRWEGDRIFGAADNRITVTNGLFNIQFGDTSKGDPALTPGLFNTQTYAGLYLEVELPTPATATCAANGCATFSEGAMTPRQPLASSPYAINSDTLDGLDSSAFAQLSPAAQQTGALNISGNITSGAIVQSNTIDAAVSGALTLGSSNATSIALAKNTTMAAGLTMNLQGTTALSLGSTSAAGGMLFKDGTSNNYAVTLSSPALTASYSLSLPTIAPGTSQCLQSGSSTASQLVFASCSGSVADLQSAYTASTSPATINLNVSAKDFVINATSQTTGPNILFNLQCSSCSTGTGRFAVQAGGTDVFTVNPAGSIVGAPPAGQNLTINLAATSGTRITSSASPSTDQLSIDNTAGTGITTANINALSLHYKGGAAAVEASGMRVDFIPGTTSGGTWSGLRIVANATGPATGVTEYGIKLEGPTTAGAGAAQAVHVGSGWDIGLDLQSGGIQLAAQADPASPAANNIRIFAKNIAGRTMPKWLDPNGDTTPFQANLGFNRVAMMAPGPVLLPPIS
ncbi:MAG: hypothetical protein NVS3B29_07560 [Candidatus Saccharimonadales bacterium]